MFANLKKVPSAVEFFFDGTVQQQQVLSDSQKRALRVDDWVSARSVVHDFAPAAQHYLFKMAESASAAETHLELNQMETRYLDSIQTKGAWWRRKRFWAFVDMIGKGHIPRDLTPAALGN